MKLGIYSIKDTKIGFNDPMVMHNDEVALRAFKGWVNSKEVNTANQFIEDKELYKLGEFNTLTGEITPDLRFMSTAIELKIGGNN